jgi:hypothetical protein
VGEHLTTKLKALSSNHNMGRGEKKSDMMANSCNPN